VPQCVHSTGLAPLSVPKLFEMTEIGRFLTEIAPQPCCDYNLIFAVFTGNILDGSAGHVYRWWYNRGHILVGVAVLVHSVIAHVGVRTQRRLATRTRMCYRAVFLFFPLERVQVTKHEASLDSVQAPQ